jgi:tRNA-2-methylthio-N6-dimethylallyladenosine synthase
VGCDQQCSFCIVPSVRGPQIDRPLGEIVAEVESAFSSGTQEVTLLGQNVNAYGKKGESNFAEVLGAVARTGIPRIRFMSPHPGFFTDSVIETMAKFDNIMPSIHFPLQSGSSRVLKEMNRGYNLRSFLAILEKLRAAIPQLEVTTDIIVGFPGETDADHRFTCEVIERAQFLSAFTVIFSPRPGTRAAGMGHSVSDELIKKRFKEIVELQEAITLRRMRNYLGQTIAVMLNDSGKKDSVTRRISGRSPQNILTHIDLPAHAPNEAARILPRFSPGQIIPATVSYAAPHHLIAQISEY